MANRELRYYQTDAIKSATREIFERGKSTIISLATGCGKTLTAIHFVKQNYDLRKQRVLFVVDRVELVKQGYEAFKDNWPELEFDYQNGIGMVMNSRNDIDARIIIATPQSISDVAGIEPRLDQILRYGKIDLLILDEAHSTINAIYLNLIKRLKEHNSKINILGLTATPVRHDGQALSQVFNSIAYHYPLQRAISEGFLVPLIAESVETGIELPDGRASVEERARILNVDNWTQMLYKSHQTLDENRRGIYYLPSVEHSQKFCDYLVEHGVKAAHMDFATPEKRRKEIFDGFMSGNINYLCNNILLSVGVDLPPVNFIGLASPTTNRVLTTQKIGRSTRLYPGKENSLIRDFYLQGIELVDTGTLLGLSFKQKDKPVEDEGEVLLEGIDLRDLVARNHYVTGNGIIRSKFDLFRKRKEAWMTDDQGDIDTTTARGKWADDDVDLSFAVLSPNYALANKLQEGLANGLKAKTEKPGDLAIESFYDTLYNTYNIVSNYSLWEWRDGTLSDTPLFVGETYDELMDRSIEHVASNVNPAVGAKNKPWRRSMATDKQLALLRQLGYNDDMNLTKGQASQLITHYKFAPKLRKHVQNMLKRCDKYGTV